MARMSDTQYPSAPGGYPQAGHPQGAYPAGYPQGGPPGGYAPGPGGPGGPGGHAPGPQRPGRGNLPIIVAIAVLAVVAVGTIGFVVLGGDDDGGGAADGPRADLTLADLEPALLAPADVPEGFESTPWEDDSGDDFTSDQIDGSPACEEVLDRFSLADSGRSETGAEFEAANGATIEHTLSIATAGDVTVDEVLDGVNTCGSFGFDDGESSGQITMSAEPVDGIGDSALLLMMQVDTVAEGYDVSVEMNGILWDRSGIHSSVGFTAGFDEGDLDGTSLDSLPIDQGQLRSAAEAVDAKLQPIVGG
jgi:hypothetical protein